MNPAQLFSSLEAKYRLPEGYLSRVYQLESSSGKKLYNEQSGATGPFQFMPGTARGMGLQDPNDLAQSADAAARLAVQNRAYLQQNGVENVDGRVLYLAHVQGAGGAQRLLENADKPATAVVGKEPVVQNAGRPDQKAGEFAGFLMDRYQPTQGEAYSALGTSAPVDEAASAAPTQETSVADSGDERRRARALNTLLNISQGLQQENRPQPLPIPRLSYAEGGIVNFGPEVPGFFDGGFVDFYSYVPAYEPPVYSYTPAYEPPSYSYTPAYEPPSYSYTYTPVYETPIYTPPEVYTPPYEPPVYEYTYVGTPDFTQPPLVDDSMVYSTLDPNAPQYSGNLTYADVSSISPPLYTGGDYSYTGVSGPSGGDIYTGAPGYTGNAGSILQDALVDAGYAQPTEYIGVATNPPAPEISSGQSSFNNIMDNIVLPSFGIDPNATARPLTEAELAAQVRGPFDEPENLVSRGDASLATVVGTGRPANEVAAEEAAARLAAAEQAARDQAALAAYQSGMSGIYGTAPETGLGQMTPASPDLSSSTLTALGEAPPAPTPTATGTPDDLLSSILGINPRETARELTSEELAQQAVGPFDRPVAPPVAQSGEQGLSGYSQSYVDNLTNAFLRLNETGETVSREEALAATRALLASREQGVTLSARAALEQGRAELSPPTQEPVSVSPPEVQPAPLPEVQPAPLPEVQPAPLPEVQPTPVVEEVPEGPTSVGTFPTDSTLGYTISQGFTGQPVPAPTPAPEPVPVEAPPPEPVVVRPPTPPVVFDSSSFFGQMPSFTAAPETASYVPVRDAASGTFVLGGIESQTPGNVSGQGIPELENTDRGGFEITGPTGYGPQDDRVVNNYVAPYIEVPELSVSPTFNYTDFGRNVTQQNIPELGVTSYGVAGLLGPTGLPPSTSAPRSINVPPPPAVSIPPASTGTLRIPVMPSLTESLPTFPTGGTVPTVRPYTPPAGAIFAGIPGGGGGGVAPVTPPTTPTPPLPEPSILYDLASFLEQQPRPAPGVTPYVGIGSLVPPSMYVPEFGPSPFFGPVSPAGMRPISDANLPEFGPIPAGMRPISDANLPEFGPIPADTSIEQPT
jgi:hypothetical protein